jgi:hypothetical protein
VRTSLGIAVVSWALLLAGCTGTPVTTNTNQTASTQGIALAGKVHGGQNPVVGAHVYLYAVNNTGWAGPGITASTSNAAKSLLNSTANTTMDGNGHYYVTTDSNGYFSITGDYTCPTATPNTYILSVGGDSGAGANSAIVLAAGAGDCTDSDYTSRFIVVNEVSTVASVWAYAGFTTDPTHVSSSPSALAETAIDNAADSMRNLFEQDTGLALATTPAGNGTLPQSEINTLANILAACVNSTGSASTPCTTLFGNAMNGSNTPSDTTTAAINIAHNPGANVAALFALQTPNAPFQPMLSAAPNDFTIVVRYTGGGLDAPYGLAIDAAGNIWVTNENGDSISKFAPDGAPLSGSSGFTGGGLAGPGSIAIDASGNAWIVSEYEDTDMINKFTNSGTAISGPTGFTGGGLSSSEGIAIDKSGNVWVANHGNDSVSEFSSSGTPISGDIGYTGGGLNGSCGIAIDTSGNAWIANLEANQLSEFTSAGTAVSGDTGFTGGGLDFSSGIAIDDSGNVWIANNDSISKFSPTGTAISGPGGYTGGGLSYPWAIAVDGSGNIWTTNAFGSSVSEFSPTGTAISGPSGYVGGMMEAMGIGIDGSGNVWVTNAGYGSNEILEFVGAATPVVTPIVANLRAPYGTYAVNRP